MGKLDEILHWDFCFMSLTRLFFLDPYIFSRAWSAFDITILCAIMVHVTGIGTQMKDVFVLELRADFWALYLGANAKVGVACTLLL